MADIQQVLEAAQAFGRAHRAFRDARAEGERRIDEIQQAWVRGHEDLLLDDHEEDDEFDYLDDDLIEAAKTYLLTGEAADGAIPDDVRGVLDESRRALAEELRGAAGLTEPAREYLVSPNAEFCAAVRSWFAAARAEGDVAGWPQVLGAWRTALSMTTREAASVLEVSPSAVVRYEAGKRSPSVPQIGAMVECIVVWDPTSEDAKLRKAVRAFARMFGEEADVSTDILQNVTIEHETLVGEVEDVIERLTVGQLRVLAALVASPAALDRLACLVKDDPLGPITHALARLSDATTVTESK